MKSSRSEWKIIVSAFLVAGCGAFSESKKDSIGEASLLAPAGTGCVQGVVINGLTGDRVEMTRFSGENGIFVMVRDQFVNASNVGLDSSAKQAMTGQYSVCGIPTDEDYPLFVHLDGYQSFEGLIHIASTVRPLGDQIETHLVKASPSTEANIVLYPSGTKTQDLNFSVYYNGSGVKDATVQLRPTGRNVLDKMERSAQGENVAHNNMLAPRDVRLKTLTAVTSETGEAVFSKDSLVLGGIYKYVVLPPDNMTYVSTKLDAVGTVVVGLQASDIGQDPYRYSARLTPMAEELKVLQLSTESQSISPDGSLIVLFNRPVEIVSNPDNVLGKLTNAVDAELMPEIPYNQTSDTAKVELSSDGLSIKLTPKYKSQPNSAHEPALTVTYSGLQVRPAAAPGNAKILAVPAATVKLFGYDVNPALLPLKMLMLPGSDDQHASPSTQLANPVSLKVLDQFGLGLRNQTVSFTVASGGGTIKRLTDTSFATSVTVVTDADGVASVNWALGAAAGTQRLQAKVGNLSYIEFVAKAE